MRWIKQHKLITLLIVIILATTVLLVSAIDSRGVGNGGTNLVNDVVTAIETPFVKLAGNISSSVSHMFSYKDLEADNEALKEENAKLKEELNENRVNSSDLAELNQLADALNYSFATKRNIVTADVVSYDGANWMNLFTINVGTNDKVKVDDIVLYGSGLVGRVSEVGKDWAKVVSLIDESCNVSFKASRNNKLVGIVSGSTDGELSGYMLNSKSTIVEGDTIVTTGMGLFPKGIEIGTISEVKYDSDSQLKTVKVKAAIDFSSLQKVSVVL